MKILSIVGARPQFIKLAPLANAIQKKIFSDAKVEMEHIIIHTGQHYDYQMNKVFFDELDIPDVAYNLEVGSGPHGWQTGMMLQRTEDILMKEHPDMVLVYGDTNSTLAGAMAASKLRIAIAHVEAGLRSYNRQMPEEINRILTDRCSDILFCPTENATQILQKEGFANIANNGKLINLKSAESLPIDQRFPLVANVGDIMYDSILLVLEIAKMKSNILEKLKIKPKTYYLATVHRPDNADNRARLKNILDAFNELSREKPVIFPVHPRTMKNLEGFHLISSSQSQVHMIGPVSYYDMLILEKNAAKILTDSGGMQKEAYLLNVPCITLRDETEWVETLGKEYNVLAGTDRDKIIKTALTSISMEPSSKVSDSPFGDGHAAERILSVIRSIKFG